ncbi:Splicing factor, arginine/serine-rich 18 [Camponotus floridanus]|uniref:Splicing factor, arginine/serine-rich 18 n=1 Tax=Camponotus floridanus TaxID=104421 RepID=E2AXP9_CAMFO|nr:Splicing factor, arginine/serine-rich 18 [Camponotus floridanus]
MSGDMFDGKDYPTQWALNPTAYQNMSNDQVDWAALAQQWIKMKETVVPPAPPPPTINPIYSANDGSGEAPMDMDTKDDEVPPAPPAPTISGSETWTQWNQWGHWNTSASGTGSWEWSGVPPPGVTIGPDGKPIGLPTMPVIPPAPTISTTTDFNAPPPAAPSLYSYNSSLSPAQSYNQVTNYWSGDAPNTMTSQPPPFMKGMRHPNRTPHMRVMDPVRCRDDREKTPEEDTTTTIDAAKRRQLPAWIREGLEKMEKEKQKAVERERLEILRKQELEARKQAEDEARAVLNPSKSKFDSDSEKETEQDFDVASNMRGQQSIDKSYDRTPDIIVRPRKSRFRDADSPESHADADESPTATTSALPAVAQKRSLDEIFQDVMLKVRRSLTEILLEVTNEEIATVCREVWSRARAKGLGIYGDSNSESEEEQSEHAQIHDDDSDEELKETLRRRQQAFRKTEEEIEARLAEEEEREEQRNYEEQNSRQQENHTGNTSCRESVDEKETINNQREASETLSSGGQSPQTAALQNAPTADGHQQATKAGSTVSGSADSESSSTESTSSLSESSRESAKKHDKARKTSKQLQSQSQQREQQQQQEQRSYHQRRRKSKSRSKSRSRRRSTRSSRSSERVAHKRRSRSRSAKSRKNYRSRSSRSSSDHRSKKRRTRSRDRKRARSRSRSYRRSRSASPDDRKKWSSRSRSREVDDGAVDPDRGIEIESRDLNHDSRAIAMVRSRHIDTGIEPDLLS